MCQLSKKITDVNTIAERLKLARETAGLTQPELAGKAGVSQGTIGNIESGLRKRPRDLLSIASALGVSPEWLETGKGQMIQSQSKEIDLDNNPDYPAIRRVKFKLSAGVSGFAVDYQGGNGNPLVFRRDWYEKNGYTPSKLFATYVANGSMEPGLYDGDTVVVNTEQVNPKDGAVFAVNYEGELVIKRLVRDDGQWWLSSDNPDQRRYPRKVCHEGVLLIGEIVHKQSERI